MSLMFWIVLIAIVSCIIWFAIVLSNARAVFQEMVGIVSEAVNSQHVSDPTPRINAIAQESNFTKNRIREALTTGWASAVDSAV